MNRPSETLIKQAVNTTGGFRPAARFLREQGFDISESGIRGMMKRWEDDDSDFELETPVQTEIDIDALISRRIEQFAIKKQIREREQILPVRVKLDGPIGLGFMGDPHIDDDGTDIQQLFEHVDLFGKHNEGLFACNLGDVSNNWIGKLSHLWSEQSTSAAESRALVNEFLGRTNWLFYIHGNHDCWGGGNNLLTQILAQNAAITKEHRVRVGLRLPNGRNVKIHAAHGFRGKSMWSEVYGAARVAQLDGDHHDIYAGGHIHTSGYAHGMRPSSGRMWHAIQVASYKKFDRYADELGLDSKDLYNCPVALIDPEAKSDINFIRWEFDPFEGAERLRWMRSRWNAGKSAS